MRHWNAIAGRHLVLSLWSAACGATVVLVSIIEIVGAVA